MSLTRLQNIFYEVSGQKNDFPLKWFLKALPNSTAPGIIVISEQRGGRAQPPASGREQGLARVHSYF